MRFMLPVLIVVLASSAFSEDYTVTSVATSDDALAVFGNPAGLAAGRVTNAALFYTEDMDESEPKRRLGLALASPTFGLGYSYWNRDFKKSMISSAIAGRSGSFFSFGVRGRWLKVLPGSYFGVDLGVLFRPINCLSLGAVVNNANRPAIGLRTFDRNYKVGLGLRPMTDRMTLFAEWSRDEDLDADQTSYKFGALAEPVDGIVLRGSVDDDLTYKIGLLLEFRNSSAGYTATADTLDGLVENGLHLAGSFDINRTILAGRGEIAEIKIAGRIEDAPAGFSLLGGSARSLRRIVDQLRKAEEDETVEAVLLDIRTFSAGTGTVYEIRDHIKRVRSAGKKVVSYLEEGGMDLAMYLATAADEIVACPTSEIIVKGPYAQVMMLKGLLDKLGVEADLIRAGKYKSAVEPLTKERLSREAREQIQELVDAMFDEITVKIFSARNIERDKMEEILEKGISRPDQAKELGLIDHVGYYDDAKLVVAGLLARKVSEPDRVKTTSLKDRVYRRYSWTEPPKVAVVQASGSIVTGPSRTDFLYGSQYVGSETLAKQLKRLRVDRTVKAVVLRVDSPGGDGLASDLIWREVDKIKRSGKPIVVSMSDVAASGGYYISCAASRIFADPTTITGSIGVFGGKAVLAGTYGKLGINPEVIKSAEHSDAFSPARRFTEKERRVFQDHIDSFYDDFVVKVSEGRGLDIEKVRELAQGRVYAGTRAKELGLVDEVGTLEDAVDAAAELAGIKEEPKVIYIERDRGFFGRMSGCGTCHGLSGLLGGDVIGLPGWE